MKLKPACGENSSGLTNKQSSQGVFLARIAFSDDLLDQKSKFPLFPGDGGPLMCIFSCSRSRLSLNGAKCNILLCDTKVHVCSLCSEIHCVVLSVPLGMSLGWDVDLASRIQ